MAKHRILSTDEDIEKALAEASSASEEPVVEEVRLEDVGTEPSIIIKMSDGSIHGIPKSKLEGLADSSYEVAADIEITEDGHGLRWPQIDLDLYVPALMQGVYGSRSWMSALGRLGGRARSEAKRSAARLNGLKGGRPRKRFGSCALEASASTEPRKAHLSGRYSAGDPFQYPPRHLVPQFPRGRFATLFGLDAAAKPRPLPRIA